MSLAFLLDGEPRAESLFIPAFGIAGFVCLLTACLIGATVYLARLKAKDRAKMPDLFWLFLGSGVCLIVLSFALERLAGSQMFKEAPLAGAAVPEFMGAKRVTPPP